jgi:UDP-N-acetylmuramoylalanine--D-glutamate ligase
MQFKALENMRVAILGAGREGQSVWRQMRRRFPRKHLSLFSEAPVDESFMTALKPALDDLLVGPLDPASLRQFDVLVRSAGISPYRDELKELKSLGLQFTTASNLWFAENPEARTICISGTKGKSTTAALTAHLLSQAGINTCLAGNIGRPMLDCDDVNVDWWVIELSSYQISDLRARPDIVVLLNLSDEHVDWHLNAKNYRSDKLRLARLVEDGRLIANASDIALRKEFSGHSNVRWFNQAGQWQAGESHVVRQPRGGEKADEQAVCGISPSRLAAPVSLPGEHNMQNLAAALTVCEELGVNFSRLNEALSTFKGLPHRLQAVGEKAGVRYVDDSISTTPVSVEAALQATGYADVVLILGGMDRGLDWTGFAKSIRERSPYAIITLPDNGPKISACLKDAGVKPEGGLHALPGLREAVVLAQTLAPDNGCVLLSPGAPSFPHFVDFEDRGRMFKQYAGL